MAVLIDSFGTSSFFLSFSDGKGLVHGYEDDVNNWIPITYETRIHQQAYPSDPQYGGMSERAGNRSHVRQIRPNDTPKAVEAYIRKSVYCRF